MSLSHNGIALPDQDVLQGIEMHYITYRESIIDILKCKSCRSYSINLQLKSSDKAENQWNTYLFSCENCQENCEIRLSKEFTLEEFDTWEKLQQRVDELKVVLNFTGQV